MKSEKMSDREIVGSITVVLILILFILGLDAIFIHGREYHEGTEFVPTHSGIIFKEGLQRGDRIDIQIDTLEERPVRLTVNGGGIDFEIKGSSMDFTVSIPTSSHYRFTLNNPGDSALLVSYDYEVVLMHSFWSGVAMIVFALILGTTTSFCFRKEISKAIKSFFGSREKYSSQAK